MSQDEMRLGLFRFGGAGLLGVWFGLALGLGLGLGLFLMRRAGLGCGEGWIWLALIGATVWVGWVSLG